MIYTVLWLPAAEQQLAALWTVSARRAEVTRAAAALNRRLAANAPDEGESRTENRRIAVELPLAVLFEFSQTGRTVAVGRVWEVR